MTTLQTILLGITILGYVFILRLIYKNYMSIKLTVIIGALLLFSTLIIPFIGGLFFIVGLRFVLYKVPKIYLNKFHGVNKKKRKLKVKERFPLSLYLESDKGTIEIANPFRGILIQGGAGSGKSRSIFYPFIKQLMENDYSGLLFDFKSPELSEVAYAYAGDKISFNFLDFKSPFKSVRLNPLSPKYLSKQAYAVEYATALINNLLPESIKVKNFWTRSSIAIIAGNIWYLKKHFPQYCTLPHLVAMILKLPSSQLIEVLVKDEETAGLISSLKEAHDLKAEKQIAGVVGTIKTAFAALNMPDIFYLLSGEETDLNLNDPEDPKFLCIGTDSSLSDTYAPIISLVISVAMRQMNQPGKHHSAILIDEAPTIYIPNIEQIPATARSNKVATIMGIQDYSQLADRYGESKAQVLVSNLGNQFFGRTTNEKTARQIVSLFGRADVTYQSVSKNQGRAVGNSVSNNYGTSVSQSIQERDRVKTTSLINLEAGKFYGLIAEGNTNELMNNYLHSTEIKTKEIPKREETELSYAFKKVYQEIEIILSTENKITPEQLDISDDPDDIFQILNN